MLSVEHVTMADPQLDNLLKQWAEHEALGDPGMDCPPASVLWRHVTELKPLSDYDRHVRVNVSSRSIR